MKSGRMLVSLGLVALIAGSLGCLNPFRPLVGTGEAQAEKPPLANSPQGALQLLRWCWVNRTIAEYGDLFTDDFRFAFSDAEAADFAPVLRFDELEIAKHLLVDGSATEPRVKRIDLEFSSTLVPIPDQRPGKIAPWHKQITTGVVLRAYLDDVIWDIHGDVTFFLVRADSARIPQELLDLGRSPKDPRWYIERWEDHTDSRQGNGTAVARLPAPPAVGRAIARALSAVGSSPVQAIEPVLHGSWGALQQEYRSSGLYVHPGTTPAQPL